MVGVICNDNRFELILKYKKELLDHTNIETSKQEMEVINSVLFRFWQMGWLDKLEEYDRQKAEVERLNKEVDRLSQVVMYNDSITETKVSEARKEFWDRLKKEAEFISGGDYGFSFEIREDVADNLLKEMEGEE